MTFSMSSNHSNQSSLMNSTINDLSVQFLICSCKFKILFRILGSFEYDLVTKNSWNHSCISSYPLCHRTMLQPQHFPCQGASQMAVIDSKIFLHLRSPFLFLWIQKNPMQFLTCFYHCCATQRNKFSDLVDSLMMSLQKGENWVIWGQPSCKV